MTASITSDDVARSLREAIVVELGGEPRRDAPLGQPRVSHHAADETLAGDGGELAPQPGEHRDAVVVPARQPGASRVAIGRAVRELDRTGRVGDDAGAASVISARSRRVGLRANQISRSAHSP